MLQNTTGDPLSVAEAPKEPRYRLVKLPSGAFSVHSLDYRETFHPVVGPVAEAEALYVKQLKLPERFARAGGEFVVWDVGLGSAGNALTLLKALREISGNLRLVSFDHTLEPLRFALQHRESLGYLEGYEDPVSRLVQSGTVQFQNGMSSATWAFHGGDFPTFIRSEAAASLPKPHAIMFDAFSPATNPEMWTQPLFARVFELLDPARPCALPTYSRSTLLRSTLLLAGFYVGRGHATGEKEETTIAANSLALLEDPLDARWLERANRSSSAEPLWEPIYRQAPLLPATAERLRKHRQFA